MSPTITAIPGAGAPVVRSITVPVMRPVAAEGRWSWWPRVGVRVGGWTAVLVGRGVSVGRGCALAWGVLASPGPAPAITRHRPVMNRTALRYDRRIVMHSNL